MNDYERLINNSKYLLDDFGKYSLDVWIDLFVQETIDSGLYVTADNMPSGGLIVLLAVFGLKDPDKIFAQKSGRHMAICVKGNGGKDDYEVLCTFRLKNPDNPKASLLGELGTLGAPSGLFNVAKQVIMNMQIFYEMPG